MTGRRGSTTAQPTPIEETEPTAPPQPAPDPDGTPPPEPEGPQGRTFQEYVASLARPFAAAQQEDYPLGVHEAIAEVTRRVEHIGKEHRSESGERYAYRGIDDVLLALHPILGDVGLVIMPGRMIEHRRETRLTSQQKNLNVALVRVRYRLIGPDGSATTGEAWGEAHDSGDKATQKALSQAYKSFTLQLFSIPTEASADDDADRTNEPARPFTAEEVDRATRAYRAAEQAETMEVLFGIRQRALHLLDVPLVGDDGGAAPLSVLFDRRRAELEGAQS